ncbi:hypothetical protein [Brevundimonas pondensis]|uniref:DUF2958 domain-containing protein n=1 Tax=Brevundimonas pondensis TaxID=2774189 RepID=A0ABX7SP38_9CAUL|nr:hypothetical protein [Brevundimonas pondensis]QTC88173.1 hypothetical protein IFE19_01840 [Brevundimonas pondensis]
MSADILKFPTPAPRVAGRDGLAPGDLLVTCFNDTFGLWCAWPVAAVDDDGVAMGVRLINGRVLAADRVSCRPDAYGFRRAEHAEGAFERLAYRTWPSAEAALADFGGPC